MPQNEHLAPLVVVLRDLVAWLQAKQTPGIVIGGVAASVLGRPRFTQDVDALVLLDNIAWADFLSSGTRFVLRDCIPKLIEKEIIFQRETER